MRVAAVLVIGLVVFGCQDNLRDIDARTARLLDQRSNQLGGGAIAPDRQFGAPATERRADQIAKTPPSVNPAASDLRLDPADESRDVAARLDAYEEGAAKGAPGSGVVHLTLEAALRQGQLTASEYLAAEEEYILAAISLLIERHLWGPRLFNDTSVTASGQGTDGSFSHALQVMNDLRLSQRLPYGGEVEAGWVWAATDQLRSQVSGQYVQSSQLVFSGTLPLLRGAGLIAQESLIQSERNLVYQARNFEAFRRDFLVSVSRDYFDLLQSQAEILNQEAQLKNVRRIEEGQTQRFLAGRVAEFEKNTASNNVLEATASLAGQREAFILQLERFKIRLGLRSDQAVELDESALDIPDPEITLDRATDLALAYRLDLQNRRDQVDDSARAVENARNQLLPNLDLNARTGIPTRPSVREGGVAFQPEDLTYSAGVTFGLPLDREQERLGLRSATISLQARRRDYDKFRDEVAVGVRQAVRTIDLSRFQLRLAEEQVHINERRVQELELKAAEVDTQRQLDAANNLQQSKNNLARAKTTLRNAILAFLRDSGQLRVKHDGTIEPLPGMERRPAPAVPEPAPPPPAPDANPPGGS